MDEDWDEVFGVQAEPEVYCRVNIKRFAKEGYAAETTISVRGVLDDGEMAYRLRGLNRLADAEARRAIAERELADLREQKGALERE